MQNLLESEFLSSHGSCVRKQVNVSGKKAVVNTGTGRNLYSPTLYAPGGIQMSRPLHSPFLSHFLVINLLFGWRQQWDQAAMVGREQLGSPEVTTLHFCEATVLLREATPSWDIEHTGRGQGCLSSAIQGRAACNCQHPLCKVCCGC